MAKSKFFRIAVEGGTTDGRVIEREWLEQMAADYNPATYGARINLEHLRGFSPEPPFNCYGDVLALETREIELELGGKTEKRLGLYAQVDATDGLVKLRKDRQKLYSSCEIAVNFAGTSRAYLVGLAFTDTPASLGTEMLTFAAGQGEANPLAGRKQDAANLFSAAELAELELELETPSADGGDVKGLVQLATEFFAKLSRSSETPPAPAAPAVAPVAPAPGTDQFAALQPIVEQLATAAEAAGTAATAAADQVAALSGRVDELSAKLDATPAPGAPSRPLASGGNGYARTDC